MCLSGGGGGGGAKTPTLDPVCIRETPEKMIVWSLPPQMKNPRYGPEQPSILTNFEMFENVVTHSLGCLLYLPNQN